MMRSFCSYEPAELLPHVLHKPLLVREGERLQLLRTLYSKFEVSKNQDCNDARAVQVMVPILDSDVVRTSREWNLTPGFEDLGLCE